MNNRNSPKPRQIKPACLINVSALSVALLCGGCATIGNFYNSVIGNNSSQQVTPDQFVQRNAAAGTPLSPVDQPGAINVDQPRAVPGNQGEVVAQSSGQQAPKAEANSTISPAVAEAIKTPGEQPASMPAIGPALLAVGPTTVSTEAMLTDTPGAATVPSDTNDLNTGQYMPLGGVVATVNGQPIFANRVLQLLGPALKNDARQYDRQQFATIAHDAVTQQILDLERDEIDYAAAERNLDNSDKERVKLATAAYRGKLITDAGGSVEAARNRASVMGEDFDEKVHDQYRTIMIRMYYSKKFGARTIPSADEMRDFYQQNIDHFRPPSSATFDLIVIDPAHLENATQQTARDMAFARASEVQKLAATQDFTKLFVQYNNDPGMAAVTDGLGKWNNVQKGAFSIPEVEDAVWKLKPGQTSDVLNIQGKLYIAKLESRQDGTVKPFDNDDVQGEIMGAIQKQRIEHFRTLENDRLQGQMIETKDEKMIDTTIGMALQNYDIWRAAK